jgi:hypothetical protein
VNVYKTKISTQATTNKTKINNKIYIYLQNSVLRRCLLNRELLPDDRTRLGVAASRRRVSTVAGVRASGGDGRR